MESKYCFEISFPSIDLDLYYPNSDKCHKTYHAHLLVQKTKLKLEYSISI
jgi:hypothetical protein